MTPSVAVIIPVSNGASTLGDQLTALARQQVGFPFEVVVVLDGCTDDTERVARSFEDVLDLTCVPSHGRGSAAAARNTGVGATHAEFLLFCDDDDVVAENWVEAMVAALERADIAGAVVRVDRTRVSDSVHRRSYAALDGRAIHDDAFGGQYVLTAGLGVRRPVFEALDGFDELFPGAGGEDVDFSHRALRSGAVMATADTSVSYTPRSGLRSRFRQRLAYGRGGAINRVKNGGTITSTSMYFSAFLAVRRSAATLLRDRPVNLGRAIWSGYDRYTSLRGEREAVRVLRCRPCNTAAAPAHGLERTVDDPFLPVLRHRLFDCPDAGAAHLVGPGLETITLMILTELLRPGDTFADGGANIGLFSVAAGLTIGPTGKVIAFEPLPTIAAALTDNMRRHCPDVPFDGRKVALGSTTGVARFHRDENSPISSLHGARDGSADVGDSSDFEVAVRRLDDEILHAPAVLKLDIEGSEVDALEGGRRILAERRTAVIAELNPNALRRAGRTVADLLDIFSGPDWEVWLVDDRDPHEPLVGPDRSAEEITRRSDDPCWWANVVALPEAFRVERAIEDLRSYVEVPYVRTGRAVSR